MCVVIPALVRWNQSNQGFKFTISYYIAKFEASLSYRSFFSFFKKEGRKEDEDEELIRSEKFLSRKINIEIILHRFN